MMLDSDLRDRYPLGGKVERLLLVASQEPERLSLRATCDQYVNSPQFPGRESGVSRAASVF
jgi:hypothetical protein